MDGYLTVTARYGIVIGLTVIAFGVAYWLSHQLTAQGNEELARCIDLCRDVGNIATTIAVFTSRNSEFNPQVREVCAEVLDRCVESCRKMSQAAEQFKAVRTCGDR